MERVLHLSATYRERGDVLRIAVRRRSLQHVPHTMVVDVAHGAKVFGPKRVSVTRRGCA
jgi:hypothetical protein